MFSLLAHVRGHESALCGFINGGKILETLTECSDMESCDGKDHVVVGVSKTRGRGRDRDRGLGRGRGHFFLFFFQRHRSFVGQIRIKANIKKVKSLKLTSLG